MQSSLTIREVAERFGIQAHTLRYYERAGLLDMVGRNVGGHRRYSESDLEGINFILKMRQTGMGIAVLRDYVQAVREGRATLAYRTEILEKHREEVKSQIEGLQACLDVIEYKLDLYAKEAGDDCKGTQ